MHTIRCYLLTLTVFLCRKDTLLVFFAASKKIEQKTICVFCSASYAGVVGCLIWRTFMQMNRALSQMCTSGSANNVSFNILIKRGMTKRHWTIRFVCILCEFFFFLPSKCVSVGTFFRFFRWKKSAKCTMRSHGTIAHKEIEIYDVWDFPAIENLKREKWCKKLKRVLQSTREH